MKITVQTLGGTGSAKAGGDVELNDDVFGVAPRADILHRVVTWQLEKRRGPARAARERSEVSRTGKKFGNQKGGGTARHGDRRAPIFIGGGKAHGPRARSFGHSLNKKIRTLGLKMALSDKAMGGGQTSVCSGAERGVRVPAVKAGVVAEVSGSGGARGGQCVGQGRHGRCRAVTVSDHQRVGGCDADCAAAFGDGTV